MKRLERKPKSSLDCINVIILIKYTEEERKTNYTIIRIIKKKTILKNARFK